LCTNDLGALPEVSIHARESLIFLDRFLTPMPYEAVIFEHFNMFQWHTALANPGQASIR